MTNAACACVRVRCRTEEGSRRKCGQYWPLDEGGQEVYGHMAVLNQRVDHHTHYNHTFLQLHNTEVQQTAAALGAKAGHGHCRQSTFCILNSCCCSASKDKVSVDHLQD